MKTCDFTVIKMLKVKKENIVFHLTRAAARTTHFLVIEAQTLDQIHSEGEDTQILCKIFLHLLKTISEFKRSQTIKTIVQKALLSRFVWGLEIFCSLQAIRQNFKQNKICHDALTIYLFQICHFKQTSTLFTKT